LHISKKRTTFAANFDTFIKMKENNIPIVDCPYGDYMIGDASGKLMNEYGRYPCKIKCGVYALLVRGTAHGLFGDRFAAAGDLEEDPARQHRRDPTFDRAFSLAHTDFQGLLRAWLVREQADPHLAASFHMAGDRDTGGFDLGGGQETALKRLQSEIAEIQFVAALGQPGVITALHLSVLYSFWH
jgi:hypothetical protein